MSETDEGNLQLMPKGERESTQDSATLWFLEKEVDKATGLVYGQPNSVIRPLQEVPKSKFKSQGQWTTAPFITQG